MLTVGRDEVEVWFFGEQGRLESLDLGNKQFPERDHGGYQEDGCAKLWQRRSEVVGGWDVADG